MSQPTRLKAELILVMVTLIAALGWIFSKEALAGLPPLFFMGVRFLVAGFVLLLVGGKYFRGVRWLDVKGAILMGGVFGFAMMFWIKGLDESSNLGVGAFINSLGVILVPVLARFLFAERPSNSIWLALPVAVVGLGCLALSDGIALEWGQVYFFLAALLFALQFNLLTRMSNRLHVLVLTTLQLLTAGALHLLFSSVLETIPHTISTPILGWFLASALIATSLRFLLQTYGQSLTPASHAAVIMNLEPVWTALAAAVWFNEQMSRMQVLGCGLIFVAMIVSKWTQIRAFLSRR